MNKNRFGRALTGWVPTSSSQLRYSSLLLLVAFGLHTIVDPALTYLAVVHFDVATEANPFIDRWLQAGLGPFIAIHLPMYALGVGLLAWLRRLYRAATPREQVYLYYLSMLGFSGLTLWGLALVVNNAATLWIGLGSAPG